MKPTLCFENKVLFRLLATGSSDGTTSLFTSKCKSRILHIITLWNKDVNKLTNGYFFKFPLGLYISLKVLTNK